MPLTLFKPGEGLVGWAEGAQSVNQNFRDLEDYVNSRRLPPGYVNGLQLVYVSATKITVLSGKARSQADDIDVTLSADTDVNTETTADGGAPQGLDQQKLSSTATTHGTNTFEPSSSILGDLGMRTKVSGTNNALPGSFSSSGVNVTGSGTRFLRDVSVNDLFGTDTTYGFARVASIADDTHLTLTSTIPTGGTAGLPGGNAPASTSYKIIENATTWPGATVGDKRRVARVAASSPWTVTVEGGNTTSNGSLQTLRIGVEVATCHYAVWLGSGLSGTSAFLSTQRTMPYTISGYTSNVRRIGWVLNDSSGNIAKFAHDPVSRRIYYIDGYGVLSGGQATTATQRDLSPYVPPTSRIAIMMAILYSLYAGDEYLMLRPRGTQGETFNTQREVWGEGSTNDHPNFSSEIEVPTDGAQMIDYRIAFVNVNHSAYLSVNGYVDSL